MFNVHLAAHCEAIPSNASHWDSSVAGAYRGDEPTIGLDYYGRVFQMFRAAPVSDTCASTPQLVTGS